MKHSLSFLTLTLVSIGAIAFLAIPARADNDPAAVPYIQSATPESAKAGAVITVVGTALGKANVSEIYLTKGGTDVKLEITIQRTDTIAAKIPDSITSGRYRLMILTVGAAPRYIEQPVSLTVE